MLGASGLVRHRDHCSRFNSDIIVFAQGSKTKFRCSVLKMKLGRSSCSRNKTTLPETIRHSPAFFQPFPSFCPETSAKRFVLSAIVSLSGTTPNITVHLPVRRSMASCSESFSTSGGRKSEPPDLHNSVQISPICAALKSDGFAANRTNGTRMAEATKLRKGCRLILMSEQTMPKDADEKGARPPPTGAAEHTRHFRTAAQC